MRVVGVLLTALALSACSVINQLTLPLRSEAYKLGYEVGVELKDVSLGVKDLNNIFLELNEWTDSNLSTLDSPDFDIQDTCDGLFELSGLIASLQGYSVDNTPESKSDFASGCVAGFES